jgi:hypothetical protein
MLTFASTYTRSCKHTYKHTCKHVRTRKHVHTLSAPQDFSDGFDIINETSGGPDSYRFYKNYFGFSEDLAKYTHTPLFAIPLPMTLSD